MKEEIKEVFKNLDVIDISKYKIDDIKFLAHILKLDIDDVDLYNNWYRSNERYYYFKEISTIKKLYNELIGVKLCKLFNLPCIKYMFAFNGESYGLLSENFMDRSKTYKGIEKYGLYGDNYFIAMDFFGRNGTKLVNDLKRMIAMDIYMMQTDRDNNLFLIDKDIKLASLLDFERSFEMNLDYYDSSYFYLHFEKDADRIKKDVYFMNQIKYILSLNINSLLQEINNELKYTLCSTYVEDYNENNEQTKETIRKKILGVR